MKTERRQLHDWEKEECAALKREIAAYNARVGKEKRLTQEVIAEELGMSQGTLSSHLNGQRPINKEMAAKMSALLGVPVESFSERIAKQISHLARAAGLAATASALGPAGAAISAAAVAYQAYLDRDRFIVIPRFDISASMGPGVVVPEHLEVLQQLVVDREWIRDQRLNYSALPNLVVITGFGDSMLGTFSSGDPLLVDRGVNAMDKDGIYVFTRKDHLHIKRLQFIDGDKVLVISDNNAYKPYEVPLAEVSVHARVLIGLNVRKME